MTATGNVFLLYHYFHPDDVVSGRLFSDLARDLTARGFDVTALPSIRSCHGSRVRLSRHETWQGGRIRRVWRPNWPQHKSWGRFGNTLFMLLAWTWMALVTRRKPGEVMVVGTDPVLGVLVAIPWRILRPRARIIHWCHDVYPDAAVADGMISSDAFWVRRLRWLLSMAYARCDVIADLGGCMRELLIDACPSNQAEGDRPEMTRMPREVAPAERAERSPPRLAADDAGRDSAHVTLSPWSLVEPSVVEPPHPLVFNELFGDSRFGLLYSGNFGRAHCFDSFLTLARRLRDDEIGFCFAGRGIGWPALRSALTPADTNVQLAAFADESELAARLAAADVHLVTLRPNWTGAVVPSKFFAALAVGRPVLFAGSPDSAIAGWIQRYSVGWVLTPSSLPAVAEAVLELAEDQAAQSQLQQRCFDVYQTEFCRQVQVSRWASVVAGQPLAAPSAVIPGSRQTIHPAHGQQLGMTQNTLQPR